MSQLDMVPEVRSHPEEDPNSRYTPRALITQLHGEFRFTLDVASAPDAPSSQVIGRHWDIRDNALERSWRDERVWCNPPFDDVETWVRKAWLEVARGCSLVVMLLPANRAEQPWWQELVEPARDGPEVDGVRFRTRFLPGRIRFGHPGNPEGVGVGSPQFGCVLLIWSR